MRYDAICQCILILSHINYKTGKSIAFMMLTFVKSHCCYDIAKSRGDVWGAGPQGQGRPQRGPCDPGAESRWDYRGYAPRSS